MISVGKKSLFKKDMADTQLDEIENTKYTGRS